MSLRFNKFNQKTKSYGLNKLTNEKNASSIWGKWLVGKYGRTKKLGNIRNPSKFNLKNKRIFAGKTRNKLKI